MMTPALYLTLPLNFLRWNLVHEGKLSFVGRLDRGYHGMKNLVKGGQYLKDFELMLKV